MPDAKPTVLVVDDDLELRASIGRLLRSVGLDAQLFASVSDFLASEPPDVSGVSADFVDLHQCPTGDGVLGARQ